MAYAAVVFNNLVCFGIPLAALIWLLVRRRGLLVPFLAGVATFTASQILTRIPLLGWLGKQAWYVRFAQNNLLLYAFLLALSAGLFEELGRYIAMLLMRRHRGFPESLAFGVGHGGVEAVMIGVMAGLFPALFQSTLFLAGQPPLAIALTGIERLLTIVFHTALSVLVMRSVVARQKRWLVIAIALHTALDMVAALWQLYQFASIWVIEGIILVVSVGAMAWAISMRKSLAAQGTAPLEGDPGAHPPPPEDEATADYIRPDEQGGSYENL